MSGTHALLVLTDRLEAAVAAAGEQPAAASMSGLADTDLEDIATRIWRVMQQLQGSVLVPTIAEADQRKLHKTTRYEQAASMRDLVTGWLHCDPPVAGKLLTVGKHCVNGPFTATGAALASGEIDVEHANKVVGAVRRLPQFVDRDQRLEGEATMLTVAKTTTPEVTGKSGYRLLELIAPDKAADYLDRKAERERMRAEEARWWEMTSTPIAGCRELRVRLETSTMNILARMVASLTQPATADPTNDPTSAADPSAGDAGAGHDAREQDTGDRTLPAGGAPGAASVTAGFLPLERRRADAMAELIHTTAQPHLADELDFTQLRQLANLLEAEALANTDTTSNEEDGDDDGEEDGGGQILLDTCHDPEQGQDQDPDQDPDQDQDTVTGSVPVAIPQQRTGMPPSPAAVPPKTTPGTAPGTTPGTPQGTGARGSRFRGERASLIVITNYDHALRQYRAGEATSPGTPAPNTLSPTDVQILECEALVTPVWMTENQTPVTVASPSRYFRGKQLTALIARDRGCCFPGCSRGLRYAHAHHILPVSKGGKTKVDNGVMLCSTHHRLIHAEKGWQVRLAEDRLPEFVPPYHLDPSRTPRRHTRHELRLPVAA